MQNIFSVFVVGETLPNPTEVREENVKYKAVMYRDFIEGPPEPSGSESISN